MDAPLLVAGEWIETDDAFDVRDPFTGRVVARVAMGDAGTMERAIAGAHVAFAQTRRWSGHRRAELLRRAAEGIATREARFVELMIEEAGKPLTAAKAELTRAMATFTAAAEAARNFAGDLPAGAPDGFAAGEGYSAVLRRFAVGVVYGITPFNFPLNLVAHKLAPALACGNTIVIKPSPRTPRVALLLGEVLMEAGAVAGQVNVVTCPNEIAPHPCGDARVRHVSFTGSSPVGWALRGSCVGKGVTLELGGNAAAIVHDDADWRSAVPLIAAGAFAYAGQSCISVQRVFVHRRIYGEFRQTLMEHIVREVRIGDPRDAATVVGPMIDRAALERVQRAVEEALSGGAKLACGGGASGPCMEPTVVEGAPPHSRLVAEEIFGPVMTLDAYDDFEEAIARVNDTRYGLQAGVFTRDVDRVMAAYESLDVGGLLINQVPTFRLDHLPYGGVKESGLGREGVRWAMEAMSEMKTLIIKRAAADG